MEVPVLWLKLPAPSTGFSMARGSRVLVPLHSQMPCSAVVQTGEASPMVVHSFRWTDMVVVDADHSPRRPWIPAARCWATARILAAEL